MEKLGLDTDCLEVRQKCELWLRLPSLPWKLVCEVRQRYLAYWERAAEHMLKPACNHGQIMVESLHSNKPPTKARRIKDFRKCSAEKTKKSRAPGLVQEQKGHNRSISFYRIAGLTASWSSAHGRYASILRRGMMLLRGKTWVI